MRLKTRENAMLLLLLAAVSMGGCRHSQLDDAGHLDCIGLDMMMHQKVAKKAFVDNIYDKAGKPLLSWRVVLLQHTSGADYEQYQQFHWDEPWNSPHNLAVATRVPEGYKDPRGSKFTPYLAVTGEKAAFRPGNPRPWKSFNSHQALVVTVRDSDVLWTEPRDISLEELESNDRLRWEGSKTLYLNGMFSCAFWDRDDLKQCPQPVFEFDADTPEK